MRRNFDRDPMADEEEIMKDEDAYSRFQEDLSEREREEKAERKTRQCPECDGSGEVFNLDALFCICHVCNGTGEIFINNQQNRD